MIKKPEWKDAPKWANHLWLQAADQRYTWSESAERGCKALWTHEADTAKNRYNIWTECWDYVEGRPV